MGTRRAAKCKDCKGRFTVSHGGGFRFHQLRCDWMEMEKARGISITSTALQFAYRTCIINLLDTPGHADFSEDTYRMLTAFDSAVILIDAAKGLPILREPRDGEVAARLTGLSTAEYADYYPAEDSAASCGA